VAQKDVPKGERPEYCQGRGCMETEDLQYDPVTQNWLCLDCWKRVDPRVYKGFRQPE
jgi:hypothetical protein